MSSERQPSKPFYFRIGVSHSELLFFAVAINTLLSLELLSLGCLNNDTGSLWPSQSCVVDTKCLKYACVCVVVSLAKHILESTSVFALFFFRFRFIYFAQFNGTGNIQQQKKKKIKMCREIQINLTSMSIISKHRSHVINKNKQTESESKHKITNINQAETWRINILKDNKVCSLLLSVSS